MRVEGLVRPLISLLPPPLDLFPVCLVCGRIPALCGPQAGYEAGSAGVPSAFPAGFLPSHSPLSRPFSLYSSGCSLHHEQDAPQTALRD